MSVPTRVEPEGLARRADEVAGPSCRLCGDVLTRTFVDLGMSPLCQTVIAPSRLDEMEPFYPLHVRVCDRCLLVQLPEYVPPEEIFTEYAYFSSYSDSWIRHAARYVEGIVAARGLGPASFVVEVASNDGYLLRGFVERGIPALGIDPARNVARAAEAVGVPTRTAFFGRATAEAVLRESGPADLLVANNVLAHVPDLADFLAGVEILLAEDGLATFEFPHLLQLIEQHQFDTIYHEHFSYFSLLTASAALGRHGLRVIDVEELTTHGGSLRLHVVRARPGGPAPSAAVHELLERERARGLGAIEGHLGFAGRVAATKRELLGFLIAARAEGRTVVGYGAPGKGNTLLNFCGIGRDFLDFTVDRNPYKQGLALPGSRIPIEHPDAIAAARPDYILILPWNLRDEIAEQLAYRHAWGGRLVVPIPRLEVL